MRKELETYSKIDEYLNGSLSANEMAAFEAELASDPQLVLLVENQKKANLLLVHGKLLALKQQMQSDFSNDIPEKIVRGEFWKRFGIWGLSALLLLSGITFFVLPKTTSTNADQIKSEQELATPDNTSDTEKEEKNRVSPEKTRNTIATSGEQNEPDSEKPIKTSTIRDDVEEKSQEIVSNQKETSSSEKVETIQKRSEIICPSYSLGSALRSLSGCKGKEENVLYIETDHLKGQDLQFSLNSAAAYQKRSEFRGLAEGMYTVYLKDKQNCIDSARIRLEGHDCPQKKEAAFSPAYNETFQLPPIDEKSSVTIRNRAGEVVFEKVLSENETLEWNGLQTNGSPLSKGVYILEQKIEKQKTDYYYVTIL